MAESAREGTDSPSMTPWDSLAAAVREHLRVSLSNEAIWKIRRVFFDVAKRDQEDLAQAIFLEAMIEYRTSGRLGEDDFLQVCWRVAKRVLRDSQKFVTLPKRLSKARGMRPTQQRRTPRPDATAESKEVLEFCKELDTVGAMILSMSLDGLTLSEIGASLGLPTTTIWDLRDTLLKDLRRRFK